jgi:hypothetical protein
MFYRPGTAKSLHPIFHLFTTQYRKRLDTSCDGKYPRIFLIAHPGEELWIDIRNLEELK